MKTYTFMHVQLPLGEAEDFVEETKLRCPNDEVYALILEIDSLTMKFTLEQIKDLVKPTPADK